MTSRSVLVTGGNRGIGLAIALAFQAQGDQVAITYRSGALPEGLFGVQADVTDTESVERAFAQAEAAHGPVEILVANAGITRDGLLLRMSDEDFIDVVNTNLTGVFRCARRAIKSMLKLKRGRIIIIGSVVGHSGSAGQVNYASTKAGLVGMARSLARELGVRGITTNVIAPGFVATDMTTVLDENIKKEILNTIPLNRYAEASEVAGVAIFLASDSAAYITGAVIPVDGGLGMGN